MSVPLPRLRRWLTLAAGATLLAVVLAFVLHSAPARRVVLRRAIDTLAERSGILLHADSLDYNLLALRVTLTGVRAAATTSPQEPFLTAGVLEIAVPQSALLGPFALDRVSLDDARVTLHRRADGTTNLPSSSGPPDGEPASVLIDRTVMSNLAVDIVDERAGLSLTLPALRFDVGPQDGSVSLERPGRFARAGTATSISRLGGGLSFDGRVVQLDDLLIETDETEWTIDGALAILVRDARMDLRFRGHADLGPLARLAGSDAPVDGLVSFDGAAEGPFADISLRARASAPRLAWDDVTFDHLSADVAADSEGLRVQRADATAAGGRVGVAASHVYATGRTSATATWTDIDTATLQWMLSSAPMPLTLASAATGSATFDGTGTALSGWIIDARTRLDPRPARSRLPVGGTLTVHLANARWQLAATNTVASARIESALGGVVDPRRLSASTVAGTIVLADTSIPALMDSLRSAGVAAAGDVPVAAGRLEITAMLAGTLARPRLSLTSAARDVAITPASPFDADVTADGAIQRLAFEADVRQGAVNTLRIGGSVAPAMRHVTADVSGTVGDLSGILPDVPLTAAIDFTLRAEGGFDALAARGAATLTGARYGTFGLETAEAAFEVTPDAARVDLESHEIGAQARVEIDRGTRVADVTLDVTNADLARLRRDGVGAAGVSGSVDLRGRANLPIDDWRRGTAELALVRLDARAGDLPIRLAGPARVTYADRLVGVDGLDVHAGETSVSVSGGLPLDADSSAAGPVQDFRATLTGDVGRVLDAARAAGLLDAPDVEGRGSLAVLARLTGSLERAHVTADVDVAGGELVFRDFPPVRAVELRGRVADGRFALATASAEWQGATLQARGSMPLRLLAPYLPGGVVSALPASLEPARMTATVSSLTPRTLEPFLDPASLDQLDGTVDLSAQLETDTLELSALRGEVRLDRLDLRLAGLPVTQSEPTRLTFERGIARAAAWRWTGQGAMLEVQGEVRVAERQAALLAVGSVDLRTLTPFLPTTGLALSGTLSPRVAVIGPLSAPRIDGELALTGGEVRLRDPRIVASNLTAFAVLSPVGARVTSLTGEVNGGTITGSVSASYRGADPWSAELLARIAGMGLDFPEGLRSELDADLTLALSDTAQGAGGSLTGTVAVARSAYRQPLAVVTGLLDALRAERLAAAPTASDSFATRVALNVRVSTESDVVVDNNVARLQLGGDLRVIGTAAAPSLSGRALLREGGQLFLGRNVYTLSDSATIDFANPLVIEPNLRIEAATRAGGHEIELTLSGTPDAPDVNVRSLTVPELGQADVVSLLLTGRLLEDVPGEEGRIVGEQALAYLSGDVLGLAGRAIGLDTLRLGGAEPSSLRRDPAAVAGEADPIARLTFGKTVGEVVDITFSQSLRQGGASTWIVDYRPVRQVNLRLVSGDDNLRAYEFRHDVSFGGGADGPTMPRSARERRIAAVEITGSAPLPDAELQDAVGLSPGSTFDVAEWQRARDRLERALWRAGFMEARVSTSRTEGPSGITLSFVLESGDRTVLAVSGYPLSRAGRDAIEAAWTQSVFDDFLREEAVAIVRRALAEEGYFAPDVTAVITTDGVKTLGVTIVPGGRARTRRVVITGVDSALASDLEAWVRSRRMLEQAWREPDVLERAVVTELRSRGFPDARATVQPPRLEASTAVFPLSVVAGPRYTVAAVHLPVAPAVAADVLRTAVSLEAGAPYDPAAVDAARERLVRTYRGEGFASARVAARPTFDAAAGTASVTFDVEPGPRDVLRHIDVRGTQEVASEVVRRALDLKAGQPLSTEAWLQARSRLFDTALFRRVDVAAEPLDDMSTPGERPMRVVATVQEWPALRLRYGVQLSEERPEDDVEGRSVEPGLSADVTRRTLFGRAITTGAAAEWQRRERVGRVFANAPTFAGLPIESLLSVEQARRTFVEQTFVSNSRRIAWEQRVRVARPLRLSYSYSFERDHTRDTDPPDPSLPAFEVTANVARLTGTAIFDTRDDPTDATRGSLTSWNVEYASPTLGSDVNFVRQLAQAYHFRPWRAVTLASAARVGTVVPRGHQDLLPTELFFAGGARTVRGVDEDSLGPRNVFGVSGGQALLLFNQEARFPVYRWVRGVGFFDAGNVFETPSALDLRKLTGAAGAGIRIATPFALLRIDYGRVLFGGPERAGRWTFGIGHTF